MSRISKEEYERLVEGGKVLEEQSFGVKVWLLPDERIVKLFRTKGIVTSARIYPYSHRFARNARRLAARGVSVPEVLEIFHCPQIRRHGVIYQRLAGKAFRDLLDERSDPSLIEKLAAFLAELHEKGIYFRSVHPGNVLLLEDGQLGLIDIQDVRFRPWPLSLGERARNFCHLYNSDLQSAALRAAGYEVFVDSYLQALPRGGDYRRRLKLKIMANEKAWERR